MLAVTIYYLSEACETYEGSPASLALQRDTTIFCVSHDICYS